ncbi:MAG: transglycosylase domain-containing protein [Actinomycetota bacterium]|nr:transglycosylase domain-containing protein [Actinomycetota bacterium]
MWRYRRLLFMVVLAASTALAGAAYLFTRLPLPPEHAQAQTTLVTDIKGAQLASLDSGENRVSVGLDKVPPVLVDAVLATEDKSFFEHGGIDPSGIARATWADLRGRPLQGGSTITQQYVKNAYLKARERTAVRKLKEAALAVKVEQRFSKEQILERYLNAIYFGRGAYGVQAASRAYFAKDVGQLQLREAAYLAGLIRSPEAADALRSPQAADARRASTLAAMERAGSIGTGERAAAQAEPVSNFVVAKREGQTTFAQGDKGAQYFVEFVRRQLLAVYGPAALYEGGLRIRTTLDLETQTHAYNAVYGMLNRPDDPAGALVAIDENGYVKAMVGGKDWNAPEPFAKVNLALGREGGGTGRQPGSTFKPFVLAEAVRQGYTVESSFPGPAEVLFPKADQGRDYTVRNYEDEDFGPSVNLIDGTRNSVNTVYAQLIEAIGPAKVAKLAQEAGITEPLVPNISLTLGTSEVSVLNVAGAFTTFANRGQHVPPSAVIEVATADGRVLQRARPPTQTKVLERQQADVVNFCLQQVVQRGSGSGAQFGKPLAGKTGTTQDYGDAWFVGYTPKLTAAVWMGYPEGNARKMLNVRGRKVNGGSFPATIFKRFMEAATKRVNTGSFPAVTSFPGKVVKGAGRADSATTTSTPSAVQRVPPSPAATVPRPPRRAPPPPVTTVTTRPPPAPPPPPQPAPG